MNEQLVDEPSISIRALKNIYIDANCVKNWKTALRAMKSMKKVNFVVFVPSTDATKMREIFRENKISISKLIPIVKGVQYGILKNRYILNGISTSSFAIWVIDDGSEFKMMYADDKRRWSVTGTLEQHIRASDTYKDLVQKDPTADVSEGITVDFFTVKIHTDWKQILDEHEKDIRDMLITTITTKDSTDTVLMSKVRAAAFKKAANQDSEETKEDATQSIEKVDSIFDDIEENDEKNMETDEGNEEKPDDPEEEEEEED